MEQNKVDMYLLANNSMFPQEALPTLRKRLLEANEEHFSQLALLPLKNPTTAIILSVLVGSLGIDRFYIGDIGLGIGKLLTCGGGGIWTIIDWFLIMGATRDKNLQAIISYLNQ